MTAVENEIQITLIGTAVILLLTVYQIWSMSRAKFKHHQTMLKLEHALNTGERTSSQMPRQPDKQKKVSLFCHTGYLLQILFGILAFVSFTCWAVYLVSISYIEWAPLPGSLALIGLMTPIIAWRGFKHRRKAEIALRRDMEASQNVQTKVSKAPEAAAEIISERVESETVVDVAPVNQASPEAQTIVERRAQPVAKPVIIEKQALPQDSILKRHFLTHLRSQIASCYPSQPTDSILKRHYDQFIGTQMTCYVDGPIMLSPVNEPLVSATSAPKARSVQTKAETPTVTSEKPEPIARHMPKPHLPQDSILRRHYLTQMQVEVESGITKSHPTDSILKRHYENLVVSEMSKKLEELEG